MVWQIQNTVSLRPKGSSRIVIIFERVHWAHWGGGQWPLYVFLNVDYDALHFRTGSLKANIFKVLFWVGGREGGGHQKYSVYPFDNVDNYGRTLMVKYFTAVEL